MLANARIRQLATGFIPEVMVCSQCVRLSANGEVCSGIYRDRWHCEGTESRSIKGPVVFIRACNGLDAIEMTMGVRCTPLVSRTCR